MASAIASRMTDYRLYFRGEDGHFRSIVPLDCPSDEDAIRAVADHANGCPMELWQRERLVKAFPEGREAE